MVIETWAELVAELDRALAFASTLSLDVATSRFQQFRARLVDLDQILQRDGNAAALRRSQEDVELNAVALTESHELVTILPYLQSIPSPRSRRKLQVALQGPERPSDEVAQSNEARNTMFEFNLAARLHRAGIEVEIGGDADLEFTCGGIRWFGECKRPSKVETIENNIGDACKQLGERLSSSRLAARGLLAISVSRSLATRAPYLEYAGEAELRRTLKEHVSSMVRLMEERMQGMERCRRVGGVGLLVAHVLMPAWDANAGIPTSVQYSAGADVNQDRRGDGERLWGLIERTFSR